jgi:hypothetical protein
LFRRGGDTAQESRENGRRSDSDEIKSQEMWAGSIGVRWGACGASKGGGGRVLIRVKITMPQWPLERQTPGQRGVWNGVQFFVNRPVKECDYWVVCEGVTGAEEVICPRDNTIFITHEPPTLRRYRTKFLGQFHTVITSHRDMKHKNSIFHQQGLPWHVGRRQREHVNLSWSKDYDELISMRSMHKEKMISVVCSSKKFSPGHKQRLDFAMRLKQKLGDEVDLFGRGIREIEDKWDALAPYAYHVALENSCVDDYWTEKLADAYLAGCYPIYYGCLNIERYFDPSALTRIDIAETEKALGVVESCIRQSRYEHAKHEIEKARLDVLNKYNVFPMICEHIQHDRDRLKSAEYERVRIGPERSSGIIPLVKDVMDRIRSHRFQNS